MVDVASRIAGIEIAPVSVGDFCQTVLGWAGSGDSSPKLVAYLNAHNVNLAFKHPEYVSILQDADLVYADGMGVVWGWRRLGRELPERVNAGDFIETFCRQAAGNGLSLYLLGGRPGEAERAGRNWQASAPELTIAGTHHGYFDEDDEETVAEEIRSASPDILLAGMGAPRQEKWAARWIGELNVPVVWCVGALFEYSGGGRSRAPGWMRKIGLEWSWRLALEPKRLGERYLIGNWRYLANLRKLKKSLRLKQSPKPGS